MAGRRGGAHAPKNPEREKILRAKAVESLTNLHRYYEEEVNWTQGARIVHKSIVLLDWLKEL